MNPLRAGLLAAATAVAVVLAGAAYASTATVTDRPLTGAPAFDGVVYAVAYSGNTLYLGGAFGNAIVNGRKIARGRLAAVDATTGALLPWAPNADGTVQAIAVDGTGVYVAGEFATVGGLPRDSLAELDGSSGAVGPLRHAISGSPDALALSGSRLYVGGTMSALDGQPIGNLTALRTDTGAVDAGFAASTDDTVKALALTSGRLYLGGLFHKVDGVSAPKLAAVSPGSGARDSTFRPQLSVVVNGIAVGTDAVYTALGGQGGRVMAFGYTGAARWTATLDGDVQAVAYLDGAVYAGGHFDYACVSNNNGVHGVCTDGSISRVKLAALDSGTGAWLPWDPHANGVHGVFAVASGTGWYGVAAGGEFTLMGGVSRKYLAVFDG